jgi:hypothetical protein
MSYNKFKIKLYKDSDEMSESSYIEKEIIYMPIIKIGMNRGENGNEINGCILFFRRKYKIRCR